MHAFDNAVTIARPAGDVFAFLADFQNVPRWNSICMASILIPLPCDWLTHHWR